MKVDIVVDSKAIMALATQFPNETAKALGEFTERVGAKIEREAKIVSPKITGNLARHIRFVKSSPIAGVVKAFANYAPYVHGAPYYQNRMRRKETPFFTMALANTNTYANAQASKIVPNIIRNIIK